MRSFIIIIAVLVFGSSITAKAQQNEVEKIKALMKVQSEAWNRQDLETFMTTYWKSDSLMFIGKNGVTYGWQATLDNYKKGYPDKAAMGKLDFNLLEFKLLAPGVYLVIGKWHLTRTIGDLQGHFSLTMKKIDGEWKIVADHSS
jgi:ketosteroid isomerase-like protein